MQGADLAIAIGKQDAAESQPIITKEQLSQMTETELGILRGVLARLVPPEE